LSIFIGSEILDKLVYAACNRSEVLQCEGEQNAGDEAKQNDNGD
jgi:hypothetical protein